MQAQISWVPLAQSLCKNAVSGSALAAVLQGWAAGQGDLLPSLFMLLLTASEDLFSSSLMWLLVNPRSSLLTANWKHQFLAMWASPKGSS